MKTAETSGQMSFELFGTAGRGGVSSRMSQGISVWDTSTGSSQTLKQLASDVRSRSSERLRLVSLIKGSGSLSWQWLTPIARWGGAPDRAEWYGKGDPKLGGQAVWLAEKMLEWQTPTAQWRRSGASLYVRSGERGNVMFTAQAMWAVARQKSQDLPRIERGASLPQAIRTSSLRVNPRFVEALMGFPQRATCLTESACRCWATR